MIQFIKNDNSRPTWGILDKRDANIPQLMYKIVVKIVEAKLETVVVVTVCFICFAWIWYDFSATFPKNLPLMPSNIKYMGTPSKLYIVFYFLHMLAKKKSLYKLGKLGYIFHYLQHRSNRVVLRQGKMSLKILGHPRK